MGIYDREYYRREGPSFLGSFVSRGHVCKWLIGINVIAFVIQLVTVDRVVVDDMVLGVRDGPFTDWLLLDAKAVLHGEVWRLITSAFLHDPRSVWHILFNMLFLWWFGSDVEDLYGPREFLSFYLVSAVCGSLAFIFGSLIGIPGERALGASGAVTAVLVLCALHYPTRIILVMLVIPVPIWLFVLFSVGWDAIGFIQALQGVRTSNVAFACHLGGAGFAYAYYKLQWRLSNLLPNFAAWWRSLTRPRLRVYREDQRMPRAPPESQTRCRGSR